MEKGDNWNNFFVTSILYFEAEFAHVFEFAHGKYYTVSQVGAAGVCGPPRLVQYHKQQMNKVCFQP